VRFVVAAVCLVIHLASARADAPRDFTREVRTLYAVAACGEPPPAGFDAATVAAHCKQVNAAIATWRDKWLTKAAPFFADLLKGRASPSTVVYPFGGGDFVTALAVYPDATDYTTLSLEGMGDPRPVLALTDAPKRLAAALAKLRPTVTMSLGWAWNTTDQLSIESSDTRAGLPNILALTLIALAAHGYEPLEARYFTVDDKGALTYLTADPAPETAARKATNSVQQGPFNDIEIVFRKKGDPSAPRKTFRHFATDLSDTGDGHALAYLATKKDVGALTKAASYLLWKDSFSKIRDYLLQHMQLMVSDDTGIPPRYAKPAGFTQEVWGQYTGSFFGFAKQDVAKEMVALWRAQPARPLAFRFGYYDSKRHSHLLFTHR